MSQLLGRVLKPLVYKNVLTHNNKKMVRWFTSTSIYPYMLIDHLLKVGDSLNNHVTRRSGSEGENEIIIKSKFLAKAVRNSMTTGFDQSGLNIHMKEKKFLRDIDKVRLNIYYKPSDPKSKPVAVYLPPLPQGSQITNLAMSSLPDLEIEDWVVAIKLGSQLKLYRYNNLRWIDIETTHAHETISPYSSLMYSKRDQKFYIPTPGGEYLCSFDLNFQEKGEPKYNHVWKRDIPQYMMYELEEMNSYTRVDHLVESPSGEQFLISWYYGDDMGLYKGETTMMHKTKRFMVFKEQEGKYTGKHVFYTENIGDLCIILGHGEALCIPASPYPGLKPNCIYFVGHNYGVYDITTQTCTFFSTEDGPLRSTEFPYWPHPFSLTPHSH